MQQWMQQCQDEVWTPIDTLSNCVPKPFDPDAACAETSVYHVLVRRPSTSLVFISLFLFLVGLSHGPIHPCKNGQDTMAV